MNDKYFIAIAKEKYDSWYQELCYLGIYDCFSLPLEEVKNHNKKTYVRGVREFDYYIFVSNVNDKITMEEKDCVYSLTSAMYEEYVEYVNDEYTVCLET